MESIPDDILMYILENNNLELLDLLNLSKVSKRFNNIIKTIKPTRIYNIYRKEHLFLIERFPNIKFSYNEDYFTSYNEIYNKGERENRCEFMNAFKLKTNNIRTLYNLMNCSILDLSNTIYEIDLSKVIENFKNLENLNLSFCHINKYPEKSINVKTLKLENFRCEIDNLINFINLKSLVDLDLSYTNITDVSILNNIRKVNLSNCRKITNLNSLTNVYELILSNTAVSDISFFIGTCILILDFCTNNLRSIEYLPNLKYISLSRCDTIRDYSKLKDINTLESLNLYKNGSFKNINDIPQNIKYLNISKCYNLENISDLTKFKNLTELNCSACLDVYEIPFIVNLRKLDISYCYNIKTIKNTMCKLSYINADFCHNLKFENYDCKSLSQITLFNNEILSDVSIFRNIKDVNLTNCKNIKDVSPLSNCYKLDLSFCDNITNFDILLDIYDLNISYCKGLRGFNRFSNNHILNISNCKNITDVSTLQNVHDLNISGTTISDISSLCKVTKLNISRCLNIKDISMLKDVYNIDISFCNQIKDVSGLVNTVILTIRNHSSHIKGIEKLEKLYYLDISYSHNILNLDKIKHVFRIIL